jgi:hypothetical protein
MAERYHTRQAADPEYLHAIGQAVYSFSCLEWGVIWAAEQIAPGFIHTDHHTMTAGKISSEFKGILKRARAEMPDEAWLALKSVSDRLWDAIDLRKALLHAHPFTAEGGEQMLGRRTEAGASLDWRIEKVDAATKYFDELGVELNGLFYQYLWPTPAWRKIDAVAVLEEGRPALPAPDDKSAPDDTESE